MTRILARMLFVVALVCLALVGLGGHSPTQPLQPAPAAAVSDRAVFLAGELAEEELIALSANLAAAGHPGVLLLDVPRQRDYLQRFLKDFAPSEVLPVGGFAEGRSGLENRLGVKTAAPVAVAELWDRLFPRAPSVVICPLQPRRQLLQAAVLAGALKAPLWICRESNTDLARLRERLTRWQTTTIYAVGAVKLQAPETGKVRVVPLADETAVALRYRRLWSRAGTSTLVAANPSDCQRGQGTMSLLAPWLAIQRRAPLVLTDDDGSNLPSLLECDPFADQADHLLLAADLQSIPMERRVNPVPGKDQFIEMEPLTPEALSAFSFATGRLFHAQPGVVTLMLARQRLLTEQIRRRGDRPARALVVSNPGGGLPLLETFSRVTAFELENCGFRVTSRLGTGLLGPELRRLLPEHDVFLWEGHHSTLIKDFGLPEWTEPLPPSFVFLQSCLALTDAKAHPLLERGAIGVVGSSTRIYSATGGAFSLAYFNALLYDQQTLGGALRQAKNFLLAYSLLKEKRLGESAKLAGANVRSAWAFTLWGDPTFTLPRPAEPVRPPVRCSVEGMQVILHLPEETHPSAQVGPFSAQLPPNGRLAGLIANDIDRSNKPLVPLLFAEVPLTDVPSGVTPRLHSSLPERNWVFVWDARRQVGSLLVAQPAGARQELRFRVDLNPRSVARREALIGAQAEE